MRRRMLKSKIHRCYCTEANVDYEGSITIDPILLEAADIQCNRGARRNLHYETNLGCTGQGVSGGSGSGQ